MHKNRIGIQLQNGLDVQFSGLAHIRQVVVAQVGIVVNGGVSGCNNQVICAQDFDCFRRLAVQHNDTFQGLIQGKLCSAGVRKGQAVVLCLCGTANGKDHGEDQDHCHQQTQCFFHVAFLFF